MTDEDLLTIDVATATDEVVLTLAGELDPHTAGRFEQAIADLSELPAQVVVDLSEVRFIDSAGLRVILAADQQLTDRGSRLVLRSPSPAAQRLLEITSLHDTLNVE